MSDVKSLKKSWWPFQNWGGNALAEATLVTAVPIDVAVQKLRGFISDQEAKITRADESELILEVTDRHTSNSRRKTDRIVTFVIELHFSQQHVERATMQGLAAGKYLETRIEVTIRPRRERDRRRDTTVNKARQLLGSLKSYLMAQEDEGHWPDPVAEPAATE